MSGACKLNKDIMKGNVWVKIGSITVDVEYITFFFYSTTFKKREVFANIKSS